MANINTVSKKNDPFGPIGVLVYANACERVLVHSFNLCFPCWQRDWKEVDSACANCPSDRVTPRFPFRLVSILLVAAINVVTRQTGGTARDGVTLAAKVTRFKIILTF